MKQIALTVALFFALTASAEAWTTIDGMSDLQTAKLYRDWQAASQIPTPHVTINLSEDYTSQCGGAFSCLLRWTPGRMTLVYQDPRWLWADDGPTRPADRMSAQALFYHELTHARDYQPRKSHRYRDRFAQIMGWRPLKSLGPKERARFDEGGVPHVYSGWHVCVEVEGYCADPGEIFAMAGEWCSLNARNRTIEEWASGYGYAPTLAQHRAACELLKGRLS